MADLRALGVQRRCRYSYFGYFVVDAVDDDDTRVRNATVEFVKPLRDEPWE